MSSPRPNNEPAPRVMPQQAPSRVPALVSGIGLVVIGIVWLALFVTRMLAGGPGSPSGGIW